MPAQHQKAPFENDGFVQPYGDSPLDHENVGENIYLNIINRAKNYVYIFTPYLIIDHEMLTALCNAANTRRVSSKSASSTSMPSAPQVRNRMSPPP